GATEPVEGVDEEHLDLALLDGSPQPVPGWAAVIRPGHAHVHELQHVPPAPAGRELAEVAQLRIAGLFAGDAGVDGDLGVPGHCRPPLLLPKLSNRFLAGTRQSVNRAVFPATGSRRAMRSIRNRFDLRRP